MPLTRSTFSVFIPTADADAASYISRVGITDLQGQIDIHNFVKELKNAGVYSLLTSIYLCRSRHNKGSGTTLFDLKNAYDLTAVGSPTWSDLGTFYASAGNDYHGSASITAAVAATILEVGCCSKTRIISNNQRPMTYDAGTGATGNYFQVNYDNSANSQYYIFYTRNAAQFFPTSGATTNRNSAYQSLQTSMGATEHRQMINGQLVSTTLATSKNATGTGTFKLGSSATFQGYIGYANFGTQELTVAQLSDLEMCYNNYIMAGLMR
jgi:hypothetical protein